MKKTSTLFLLMSILTLIGCAPQVTATSAPRPTTKLPTAVNPQIPSAVSPTEINPAVIWKPYANSAFGLSFLYPANWFILDYVSEDTLRVEVGSGKVFPYGTDPTERVNEPTNSYQIVIQYTKNSQKPTWKEDSTYQSLLTMTDGESLSGPRSQLIRVGQLELARFKGFEYITTLSETGQTDHFYLRSVMLFDEQTNDLITILGQPNNVEVSPGMEWREVYRTIDEANLNFFHEIVASITLGN